MLTYDIEVAFTAPGYIAHPYWPAMDKVVDVLKKSGYARAKSDKNRRAALEAYLSANDMTLAQFEELQRKASEPFYRGANGEIVIPAHHVYGFMVCATDTAPRAIRPCDASNVRTAIYATDWVTERRAQDGVWERFATVKAGTGQKLSNQRGFRSNAFISNFSAKGKLKLNEDFVEPNSVKKLIDWGAQNIGVGASRKMGWGRFAVTKFSVAA